MTLKDLAATLPNGFHDALLHSCEWNVERGIVVLEISIWSGDLHSQTTAERERHDRRRLVFGGVRFFYWEPPAQGYPYARSRPVRIDLHDADRAAPLVSEQPADTFTARFFVDEWNSFIHIAAADADLIPLATGGA